MFTLAIAPDVLPAQGVLKRFLLVQRYYFAFIGIDPTSLERTVFNRPLAWIPMLCIMTLLGPMNLYGLEYIQEDLVQVANALSPMWQSMLAVIKFFWFMWNKEKIIRLIRMVWFWTLEAKGEELKILAEENHYDAIVSVFYYSCVCFTGILALVAPFVIASFYVWKGYGFWESLDLPMKADYFVDPKKSVLAYTLCYIWDALGISYLVNGSLAIDSLFSWFMRNISAQFRILNLRFKLAAENVAARKAQGTNSDEYFTKAITECVQYHWRVIDLANKFNEAYRTIVFIKFLISCVQLACLTFQFSHGGELATHMFNGAFVVSVSIQLMLYCYGGQRIQDMSTLVDSAIYEYFQWHDLNVKSKKLLMLPMMRSQKPCHLTGVFFVADLNLFLWVFRTAGSFLTMMLTVEQKKT